MKNGSVKGLRQKLLFYYVPKSLIKVHWRKKVKSTEILMYPWIQRIRNPGSEVFYAFSFGSRAKRSSIIKLPFFYHSRLFSAHFSLLEFLWLLVRRKKTRQIFRIQGVPTIAGHKIFSELDQYFLIEFF